MISRDSLKGITSVIAVGLAIFQIYFTAGFGIIDSQLLRTIHLGIVLALVFLYFPPKKLQEGEREHPGWLALDLVLICGAFATAYFLASDIDYYMERIRYVDPVSDAETVCATAAVLLVLEATRRVAGLPLVIVASAFLAYGLGGQYLPGILRHDGVTYKMLCEQLYLVTEGLYGIPLAVSSTMIFAFVMFGDVELTVHCAAELLKRAPEYDYLIAPEAKAIPLLYEMARQYGCKKWMLARKGVKLYMKDVIGVEVRSITTDHVQKLYIDGEDAALMKGKRILIVDDVISTGESLHALEELVLKAGGEIAGRMAILAEGEAQERDDLIYLEKLPLFNAKGKIIG